MFSDPFLGSIVMFGGNFAPGGWAFCDGQLLPINSYSALFSLLGTTYGGDGRTTFALPDLRGRPPVHTGYGPGPGLSIYTLGQKGGVENVTLNINQIPSHTHKINSYDGRPDSDTPAGHVLSTLSELIYSSDSPNVIMNVDSISNTGGTQLHNNMQPFLAVHYIIALQGLFPPRN